MMDANSRNGKLVLREMQIGYTTALSLKEILLQPRTEIIQLNLSKNLLGDKGIMCLASALAKSKSLVSLAICSNEISG